MPSPEQSINSAEALAVKIWCGVPVYNNAGTVFDVARRCREQIDHVLIIDDGSTDADLRDLLKPLDVTVIRHPANEGKGKALLTAFKYAAEQGADYLITLDGDGQHFPEDIPKFFPRLMPDAILIGYRDEVTGEMPRSSQFGRDFSDFWIRLEAGGCARDTQSGFRAYPLAAVRQIQTQSHFYNFEMEIITKALWAGLRVGNVPIRVWYPPTDQRVSSFDPFRDNLRISLLHTRLVFRQILPIPHARLKVAEQVDLKRQIVLATDGAQIDTDKKTDCLYLCSSVPHLWPNPLGLAVSAALAILMSIVLWPWGIIVVAYVTIRLHLNKIVALAFVLVGTNPLVPGICRRLGRLVVRSDLHPHLRWIAGSHLLALPMAVLVGRLVYVIAERWSKTKNHEHRPNRP